MRLRQKLVLASFGAAALLALVWEGLYDIPTSCGLPFDWRVMLPCSLLSVAVEFMLTAGAICGLGAFAAQVLA